MAINFTPDQQKVIDLHDCNILVSAAAGSGKTAVLVERIVQMICNAKKPVDIDKLLIVTFTNAAAAEMRERISQAILARMEAEPENEHLQRQSTLLHNAQITTIDSFCLFLLRNHFNDIGLDPAFRVADQGEVELLQQEVMAQMLEDYFAGGEEDFYHCVEVYCPNGKEKVLEEHILNLYQFAMSQPWPAEWLAERRDDYEIADLQELEVKEWAVYLKKHIKLLINQCVRWMEKVVKLCQEPDGPYMYGEMAEGELEQLEKLLQADTLEKLQSVVFGVQFGRLSSKKDESVNGEKREQAKNYREQAKKNLKDIQEKFFITPLEFSLEQMKESAPAVRMLVDLCIDFYERMLKAKQEKKILDFSDMEHMALQILLEKTPDGVRPTSTALEYREHFAEVLIDEYQDSNLVQEYLLKAVSGEANGKYNRFMVGDVKQSIYKFRLARPELFLEKYHDYPTDEAAGTCRRIDLSQNFRSRREVINTVNHVFSNLMGEQMGGIVYDDKAALHEGAVYPENSGCDSELLLIQKPEKEEDFDAKELEALAVAKKIRQLRKEFKVTDKATGQLRPVNYKDIVVLLRTNTGWDEVFKEVFEQEGIPAYVSTKTGYFSTAEIQQVLQFLNVLDNPLQDVPLFGVLKSVFGGFSDEEIARLRCFVTEAVQADEAEVRQGIAATDRFLYEDLEKAAEGADEAGKKCKTFIEQIAKYRTYAAYMPIRKLLQTLFDEYGYFYYVSALPGGQQRLANVEMLLEKAQAFEKSSYYGLYHFIRYMEQMQKYNVDYGEANILDENADVVRIMSIHKSKGLEFPVTFVSGLSKRFNMQDTNQAMIVDMDLGIGTDYVNPKKRIKNKTMRKNALAIKMRAENLAEEIRVLYVALTRAKEKLIMTGTLTNAAEKYPPEACGVKDAFLDCEPLSYGEVFESSSYLDWILAFMKPTAVWTGEDLGLKALQDEVDTEWRRKVLLQEKEPLSEEFMEVLKKNFTYRYPHANLAGLYTKTTVSELKMAAMEEKDEGAFHAFSQEEVVPYIPKFMQGEEKVSGTTRGNAYHKIMELLDFEKWQGTTDGELLEQEFDRLVEGGGLAKEYRAVVKTGKVMECLGSNLAKRMALAQKQDGLWKEQPFVYGISAGRLNKGENDFPEEETVLIQGIVDVFFEEEEGLVLADYKTDVIGAPGELVDRYRVQLDYYQEALEHLTGKKVKEKILYSFYLGCEIPVK
ncbi:MAG: helicase-exonuclease AddAB subunit AddA [Lachnospiraceae bacterium]|nr:helicase-exonuclease AddAB subunit AddA [Lachnospiraceae bacterium]